MSAESPRGLVAAFTGAVAVRQQADAALPFALEGAARDANEILLLAFTRAPEVPPGGRLTDLSVERDDSGAYDLRAAEGVFRIEGARHFLHRDVGAAFYRVLPPFQVPWPKRALWRTILIAARLKL